MLCPLSYRRKAYFEANFTPKLVNIIKLVLFLLIILLTEFFNRLIFGFIIPSVKSLVKANRCRLLKSWCYMAIGIEGYLYAGVPQPLLDYLGVDSLFKHNAGMGMAGVM